MQLAFQPREPFTLRLEHLAQGNPSPLGNDFGHVLRIHLFLEVLDVGLNRTEVPFLFFDLGFELRQATVLDLGCFLQIAIPRCPLGLEPRILERCLLVL